MADMRFDPEVLEVPAGNTLVIELSNDDAHDVHDLVLANGVTSGRLQPGESATVEAGTIEHDLEGWCSIVGDRKSTRLNSSHVANSYAVFCLKKKKKN